MPDSMTTSLFRVGLCLLFLAPWSPLSQAQEQPPSETIQKRIDDAGKKVRDVEALRGPDHPDVASELLVLGRLLHGSGDYDEAVLAYERALIIREESLGPEDLEVAQCLNNLSLSLMRLGKLKLARPLLERSLTIREKALGPDHLHVGLSLNNLASLLVDAGSSPEALPLLERSLRIWEKNLGPEHLDTAIVISNLAMAKKREGFFEAARSLSERTLAIREKVLGPDHPLVAESLESLADVLERQGLFESAILLRERSLKILEGALGPDHPAVAESLEAMAFALNEQGLVSDLRPGLDRALLIFENALGPEHPRVARSLQNLGVFLLTAGLYSEARPFLERSIAINQAAYGPDDPEVAAGLNSLASLLEREGLASEARPLFERSIEIFEKALGPDDPEVAMVLNNLASLLDDLGLFSEAHAIYRRALAIWEKEFGSEHQNVALAVNNLAGILEREGKDLEARACYERSIAIWEKTRGKDHPDVATGLNNLALLLERGGFFEEARSLYERALTIRERALSPDHPDIAVCLNNLAGLLYRQGLFAEAHPLFKRAIAIRARSFGPNHSNFSTSLTNLALLEADMGNREEARRLGKKALVAREAQFQETLWSLTENERLLFEEHLEDNIEMYLGITGPSGGEKSSSSSHEVLSSLLNWRGRVTRSIFWGWGEGDLSAEEKAILQDLRASQEELSNAFYARDIANRKVHGEELRRLWKRRNDVELSFARARGERSGKSSREKSASWEKGEMAVSLLAALPPSSVAVNFFVHRVYETAVRQGNEPLKKGDWSSPRVSAFVMRQGNEIKQFDLGEASVLEEATKRFLAEIVTKRGLGRPAMGDGAPPTSPATDRLRELLWDPLRESLGDCEIAIISPDTFLGTLPFGTIQEKDGSFLIEHRSFVYLQDLMSLIPKKPSRVVPVPRLLITGGIKYGRRGELSPQASGENRGGLPPRWSRLSSTGREADAIAGLFEEMINDDAAECTLLLGEKATEEEVKTGLSRHTHIHLATHGYFQSRGLPPEWKASGKDSVERARDSLDEAEMTIARFFPDLLSGLVFAGANAEPVPGRDNGLLTSEEVKYLDLSGCELVVLSACETGLGRQKGGEGMMGLRRSFRQAGARTVISSLWQVRDDSTQELMERFYENLWLKKMGKLEALRKAQLWMLARNRKEDGEALPSTWGAFVLDGDRD